MQLLEMKLVKAGRKYDSFESDGLIALHKIPQLTGLPCSVAVMADNMTYGCEY